MKIRLHNIFSAAICGFVLLLAAPSVSAQALNEVAKLLAGDGEANDRFGFPVALSGTTAVVGARQDDDQGSDSGAAYVFVRSSGVWTQQAKLVASDGVANDDFGAAVAVDGDIVVVGARQDDDQGSDSGAAYVFVRSGSVWSQQAKLVANDGAADDQFGTTVAVSGTTAVVGAHRHDDQGSESGAAYVFVRSGGNWSQQAKLVASDGAADDQFGFSVAVDGEIAVVGALNDDDRGNLSGAAYVFIRSGILWSQQAKLLASDGAAGHRLGSAVAVDGDIAIIGARGDDQLGSNSGSAYLFDLASAAGTVNEVAKLLASDGVMEDRFGLGVAVDGDIAVVSAFGDDDNGSSSGSAYVFDLVSAAGTVNEIAKLLASDGAPNDLFGFAAVALSGTIAVVGAFADDDHGSSSGSAYVFSLVSDDLGPISSNVVATPNPVAVNNLITLTANVDDTIAGGSNIASADYAIDGGTAVGMAPQDGAFDEVAEDVTAVVPAFAETGVHQLCVSGTDSASNTGEEVCAFLAVFDPAAGFVAGGGWIDSPANACQLMAACQGLTGKAVFGFVSKYKRGAQTPTGNTQFQFKAGDLNFHSQSYQWLVIANHRAQYAGDGTINGGGAYGFMLFAIDASLTPSTSIDLFRIKIWDKNNGDMLVYDNQLSGADDDDPTTAIGGGSIVIHARN